MRIKLNQKELSSLVSLSKRLNGMTIKFNKNDVALENGETVGICLNRAADSLDKILKPIQNKTKKNNHTLRLYAENKHSQQ